VDALKKAANYGAILRKTASKIANVLVVLTLLLVAIPLASCGAEDVEEEPNDGKVDTAIIIEYDSNWFFNKYQIRISLDDLVLGTQNQGSKEIYRLRTAEGDYTLTFAEMGNEENYISGILNVLENSAYYFFVKAENEGIAVKKTDTMPLDNMPPEWDVEAIKANVEAERAEREKAVVRERIIAGVVWIGIGVFALWFFLRWKTRKKNTNNVLATISVSNVYSIGRIASSCRLKNEDVVKIVESLIATANKLHPNNLSSGNEQYRIMRNARIDYTKSEIVLDENAMNLAATQAGFQKTTVTCNYCGAKTDIINSSSAKCRSCGAPLK